MQSLIHTISFKGIETVTVSVQLHISKGLPAMAIVGLADKAVAESKERVRAALSSLWCGKWLISDKPALSPMAEQSARGHLSDGAAAVVQQHPKKLLHSWSR